jgi:membrane protein YqaA with SNARE-associated domain
MKPDAPTPSSPAPAVDAAAPAVNRWHIHRRLYNWVLHWADTPHGAVALFVLAFTESSFFPVPPDVLLIAMVLGVRRRWAWLAGICTLGSALGGVAGYAIGYWLMDAVGMRIIELYHAEAYHAKVNELYAQYDYWIVAAAAFTPIPYKVFTIVSGALHMNLLGFAVVSILGRGARFFLVAGLLYLVGQPMKRFIERYFDWLALAFTLLLIGGFVLIKYLG